MKKSTLIYFIILLSSCGINKKLAISRQNIQQQKITMLELLKKADSVDSKRITKLEAGELDEKTDSVTKYYIKLLKDSININLIQLNELLNINHPKKNIKKIGVTLTNIKEQYNQGVNNIIFFDDLFSAETFSRLNTATLFGPGKYKIEDSASKQAEAIMNEIISKAISFSKKYPLKKLKAMFLVLGYADEQNISTEGELYKELIVNIPSENPDRKQLNSELSKLRAISIKNILKEEYDLNIKTNVNNNFTPIFIAIGKGESLPPGPIKDYNTVDERRRIVLLYWSLLPEN